jgi:hypothetical protein
MKSFSVIVIKKGFVEGRKKCKLHKKKGIGVFGV